MVEHLASVKTVSISLIYLLYNSSLFLYCLIQQLKTNKREIQIAQAGNFQFIFPPRKIAP